PRYTQSNILHKRYSPSLTQFTHQTHTHIRTASPAYNHANCGTLHFQFSYFFLIQSTFYVNFHLELEEVDCIVRAAGDSERLSSFCSRSPLRSSRSRKMHLALGRLRRVWCGRGLSLFQPYNVDNFALAVNVCSR
ncbi:unnamed protein product, partial [Ascophyllum nodosum]